MKNIEPLNIKAYEYNELCQEAKRKVINDYINYWLETKEYNHYNKGNFEKAIDEAERMHTPWFAGSYIYDYCKNEIENEIINCGYFFNKNGELLPIRYYTDNNKIIKAFYQLTKNQDIEVMIN